MMFAGVAPDKVLQILGKIHVGKPLTTKNRGELLASRRPNYRKHIRADDGDLPEQPGDKAEELGTWNQLDLAPAP